MKKLFTNLKVAMTLLLLCGVCNAWAETISLDAESGFQSSYSDNKKITVSEIVFCHTGVMYNNKNTPTGFLAQQLIQLRKSGTSPAGTIYNTDAINTITNIKVYVQSDCDFTVYYGSTANPSDKSLTKPTSTSETVTCAAGTINSVTCYNFDFSDKNAQYFKILNGSKANYFYKIEIEYSAGISKTLESIAISSSPTTTSYKAGDKFNPTGLVITATYSDADPENIPYSGNEDKFTFAPSLETALTTTINSVNITYAGKTTTQTISVREPYTYDITWMANGKEFAKTQVVEGNNVELPENNPASVGDMVFMGWIAKESYFDAESAPSYIIPSEIVPAENKTYYAVYAKVEEGNGPVEHIITYDTTNIPTAYAASGTYSLNGINFNLTQVYKNGEKLQWRANGNKNGTGTMYNEDAINDIQSVTLVYTNDDANKNFTLNVGSSQNPTAGTSISATKDEKDEDGNTYVYDCSAYDVDYFVLTNGANAGYLSEIRIKYIGKTDVYTDYTTNFVTISSAGWATACLPFNAEITSDNATAYYVTGTSGTALEKAPVTVIKAGEGVLLKSNNGEATTVTFTESAEGADDASANLMKGSLAGETFNTTGFTYYILSTGSNGVGFYWDSTTSNEGASAFCPAGKAVLKVQSAGAKTFFNLDDEATGINNVEMNKMNNGIRYNLNGQAVGNDFKGVVIVNGKKFVK